MRLIFGVILGAAVVIGLAFFHDSNAPRDPQHQIVNWDVLGTVTGDETAGIRRLWDRVVGRPRR